MPTCRWNSSGGLPFPEMTFPLEINLTDVSGREAASLAGANIDEQPVVIELDARVSVIVNDVG